MKMWKRVLGGILGLVIALGGVLGIGTVLTKAARPKRPIQRAIRYLADWVYLLSRKGTRWVVEWRHLQLYR